MAVWVNFLPSAAPSTDIKQASQRETLYRQLKNALNAYSAA
jgi:hypothetical protein